MSRQSPPLTRAVRLWWVSTIYSASLAANPRRTSCTLLCPHNWKGEFPVFQVISHQNPTLYILQNQLLCYYPHLTCEYLPPKISCVASVLCIWCHVDNTNTSAWTPGSDGPDIDALIPWFSWMSFSETVCCFRLQIKPWLTFFWEREPIRVSQKCCLTAHYEMSH